MDYSIRKCKEYDLNKVIELCQKHAIYEQCSYDINSKENLLKYALFSEKPQLYCFVIVINESIEGYFTYTFDFSTWDAGTYLHLDCLYLEPDYRGKKIGDKVIELLKDIAIQNNCINIQWQTPYFIEKAIRFYQRIGAKGKSKIRFSLEVDCSGH
ncbi:MAG: GNAT family N-acetyltransferase [Pseudarcicella sp.]|nr:GNAT family N-acetyltransferase [Pseudarcicella sp.]MBP6410564.1 GNAT family N-acetyltransferase [Pseudarcicella sp.]